MDVHEYSGKKERPKLASAAGISNRVAWRILIDLREALNLRVDYVYQTQQTQNQHCRHDAQHGQLLPEK